MTKMNDNLVRWNDFGKFYKKIEEHKEKMMNTYSVSGYYYRTDDERSERSFSATVLARSLEESITNLRSVQHLYRNAVIKNVELRDIDIIVGKGGEE